LNENVDVNNFAFRLRNREEQFRKDIKTARSTSFLFLIWFLSWTPYAVVSLMATFDLKHLTPTISMIPALFTKTSSVINPFIYALLEPAFKQKLKKMVLKRRESLAIHGSTITNRKAIIPKQKISCFENSDFLETINESPKISIKSTPDDLKEETKMN